MVIFVSIKWVLVCILWFLTLLLNNQVNCWEDVLRWHTTRGIQRWILGGIRMFIRSYCIKATCFDTWTKFGCISSCCLGIPREGNHYSMWEHKLNIIILGNKKLGKACTFLCWKCSCADYLNVSLWSWSYKYDSIFIFFSYIV